MPPAADSIVGQHQRARELVNAKIADHAAEWAKSLALTCTDVRFDRFREDVTEALHACMHVHIVALQYRRYKRVGDVSKDFEALADAATAAAEKLRDMEAILDRLPPMYHNPAFRLAHPPISVTFELEGLAEEARRYADACIDLGGRPSRTPAFAELARGLAQALQNSGQPTSVSWNAYRNRYRGKLFDLVEITLPTARDIAATVTGRALPVPETAKARGEFLKERRYLSPEGKTRPQ